jgi:hypothetical protein
MTYHPSEAMRKVMTRAGERWRCVRSIEGARNNRGERDAFGQRQSELNQAKARETRERASLERRSPAYCY